MYIGILHHQAWKHKTTHADALKSDAYQQHSLQIKSNAKGQTPLQEEIKTLYNQKKVNKPLIKYNKTLIYNTEEKPITMHKSQRTFESDCPDYGRQGHFVLSARTKVKTARAISSNTKDKEMREGKLEYSNKRNGRLSRRYKDFP